MCIGITASGDVECSVKHDGSAHSYVQDAVRNLQVQGFQVQIATSSVAFQ